MAALARSAVLSPHSLFVSPVLFSHIVNAQRKYGGKTCLALYEVGNPVVAKLGRVHADIKELVAHDDIEPQRVKLVRTNGGASQIERAWDVELG